MEYNLKKRPEHPTIIHGFPGIGLVSTIVTKFLVDHLDTEIIGSMQSEHLSPLVAIHKAKRIDPITIYYNQKYNIMIVQSLSDVAGQEWETAQALTKLAEELKAKEIIIIEGMSSQQEKVDIYHYSNKSKIVGKTTPLKEGIVGGLAASLILKGEHLPITCLFVQAHENMPDAEAGAKVMETLNDYLGLEINFKPLLEQAKNFESNLKGVIKQTKDSREAQATQRNIERENIDYLG